MVKRNYILSLSFLLISLYSNSQTFKFDFGTGKAPQGYKLVSPETKYSAETGYGFEFSSALTSAGAKTKSSPQDDYITSNKPFYFSVKLPEGNYNIKVLLGDKTGTSATTIKAECRRLMVEKVETAKGKLTTSEFTVHVKDSLIRSAGTKVRLKPR